MSVATLDAVRLTLLVPPLDPVGQQAAERLRRACDGPLRPAIATSFQRLGDLDRDACWVFRDLRVHLTVPASERDPARQAERIADAMALAIERAVRSGPGPDCVRFDSRAHFGASFVGAVLSCASGSWVYERLAPLRALRAVPALVAVARLLDVPLLEIVAALTQASRWPQLVAGALPDELARLERAIRHAVPGVQAPPSLLTAARATRAAVLDLCRSSTTVRRLSVLGQMIAAFGPSAEVVAAVWEAEPDAFGTPGGVAVRRPPISADEDTSPTTMAPLADAVAGMPPGAQSTTAAFAAAGAVAFMLVADLDELLPRSGPGDDLAADEPVAAAARVAILHAVLGAGIPERDAALRLAAGVRGDDADVSPHAVSELLAGHRTWLTELADDPRSGYTHPDDDAWFAAGLPVRTVAVALLRRFAGHLIGFHRSGAGYLVERFLPPGGVVVADDSAIAVELPTPPLQVVLQLAGLDSFACRPRWLGAGVTITHQELR